MITCHAEYRGDCDCFPCMYARLQEMRRIYQAMHDLCVWTLCMGCMSYSVLELRQYKAGYLDGRSDAAKGLEWLR